MRSPSVRGTLVRVLLVQAAAVLLLWALQWRYALPAAP
jgi:hypothetical protein